MTAHLVMYLVLGRFFLQGGERTPTKLPIFDIAGYKNVTKGHFFSLFFSPTIGAHGGKK